MIYSIPFKKVGNGMYAYYPISPFISRAYFINKEDKEKLEELIAKKMVFFITIVPLVYIATALFSLKGLYAVIFIALIALIVFFLKKRKILSSYVLQDFPRIDFGSYSRDFSNSLSWKDIRDGVIGSFIILLFAWFDIYRYFGAKSIPLSAKILSGICIVLGLAGLGLFISMGLMKYKGSKK